MQPTPPGSKDCTWTGPGESGFGIEIHHPSSQMPWPPPQPGSLVKTGKVFPSPTKCPCSVGRAELHQWRWPSKKVLSARPLWHWWAERGGMWGSWLPAAIAVWLGRILTGENQLISQWKCPRHGNCFHLSRKMKSRKVLLFLCKWGSKRRMSLGRREAVVHLESLKLAFEAREHIAIFFPHSINNSWQAETTLIAWDEVEQPAGSTAE